MYTRIGCPRCSAQVQGPASLLFCRDSSKLSFHGLGESQVSGFAWIQALPSFSCLSFLFSLPHGSDGSGPSVNRSDQAESHYSSCPRSDQLTPFLVHENFDLNFWHSTSLKSTLTPLSGIQDREEVLDQNGGVHGAIIIHIAFNPD